MFGHKVAKLQSSERSSNFVCTWALFLMLGHIISRGYGSVYRKPSVDHDEMGQKQTPESVYILGMHV